jgi:DNA invertase Pin-like site-specific DNA recombinase
MPASAEFASSADGPARREIMKDKITPAHLTRGAYVYIRQSTQHQVRDHLESQLRQYALGERAQELGFRTVQIVDDDLGITGTGTRERPGFARLLAAICSQEVGAVFALEASRLARNSREWAHLVDLCMTTSTLVIDHDGIYNPQELNDRLLLGLKGTMSEFEISILRQRSQEAILQKARRGELWVQLPVGYVRTEKSCEMTPDQRIQDAVRCLFQKFEELGSAQQVLSWYHDENLSCPTKSQSGEIIWQVPKKSRILSIIKNPIYAGAYAYGRRRTKVEIEEGIPRKSRNEFVPQEEWKVFIKDHHVGYITWDQYMRNQDQLNKNQRHRHHTGAPKAGHALLSGLLRCGRCGRKLQVKYKERCGRYICISEEPRSLKTTCISFSNTKVDEAISMKVLEALQPAGVQASLDALETLSMSEDAAHKQLLLAVQNMRYEVDRARRQYDAVDPENRLVAAELENRWNQKLLDFQELEKRIEERQNQLPKVNKKERVELLELGRDLYAAWHHPQASLVLKKRILRTVIQEIVVDTKDEPREVILNVHWAGGVHTRLRVARQRSGQHEKSTSREVVDLIRDLAQICVDSQVAATLNRLGYQTAKGHTWNQSRVRSLRDHRQIAAFDVSKPRTWLTLRESARKLEVSDGVVRRLLTAGVLPGNQVVRQAPWVIEASNLELPEVQEAIQRLKSAGKLPSRRSSQRQSSLFSDT